MYYLAEIGNLGFIIALIWFIFSSLLNKNKKKKNDETESLDQKIEEVPIIDLNRINKKKKPIFNFNSFIENLKNIAESESNNSEISNDLENLNKNIKLDENINSETKIDKISSYDKQKSEKIVSFAKGKKNKRSIRLLSNKLKNKNILQEAIILKEILDKPIALRKFFKR